MEVANRISFIDQLKGITILLVVIGHLIEHNAGRDNFLWTFIYSFHMPLFMFISGYLAYVTFRMERFNFFNLPEAWLFRVLLLRNIDILLFRLVKQANMVLLCYSVYFVSFVCFI